VANSFALRLGKGESWRHVQDKAPTDLYVTPDGTLATSAFYDEAGADASIYDRGGTMLGAQSGRGAAVTSDGKFVYRVSGGDAGVDKPCITRWKVDERMSGNWQDLWEAGKWSRMIVSRDLMGSATESTTDPVDEPQAKGIDTVNRPTEEELLNELEGVAPVPSEAAAPEAPLPNTRQTGRWMTGLAVHDGELYLSDAGSGVVRVYNLESFPPPGTDMAEPAQPVRTFPLDPARPRSSAR